MTGLWLAGCVGGPTALEVEVVPGGLDVHADAPIDRVVVRGPDGVLAELTRPPGRDLFVPLALPRGADLEVAAGGAAASVHVPSVAVFASLSLPAGAPPVPLADGDAIAAVGEGGGVLRLVSDGATEVVVDGRTLPLGPRGAAVSVPVPGSGALRLAPDLAFSWSLAPAGAGQVSIGPVALPVDPDGTLDPTRAPGTIPLPWRAREGPVAHLAAEVRNAGPAPVVAEVRAEVLAPGWAPRVPGLALPYVGGMVSVPANGSVRAVLPLFVDPAVAAAGPVPVVVEVRSAGDGALLAATRATATAARPGPALAAFLATLPLSLAGLAALGLGAPRFLARAEVATLALVASLGAVTFVVGAAFQLVGYGAAVALGPFAPFVTALFDDLFRVVLLAALVFRAPRPGVYAAATAVGFLMRGLALGSFHPADFLYLGNQVALGEAFLWLSGLTRGEAWRTEPARRRLLRAWIAFCPPQAIGVALGLLATSALYRLWWAPAYAAAMVLLPGTLYVALACVLAVPLATELERVAD